MSQTTQRTVFGEELEEQVTIETTGRVIRPFKRMIDQFVSECKLNIDSDGIHVCAVDAANVSMIDITLHASALETFEVAETTLGINLEGLGGALKHARYGKSSDDSITITANDRHLQTHVEREVGKSDVEITERTALIDPDSIRQEPDLPDLDLGVHADIDPKAFTEIIGMMDSSNDHIRIGSDTDSITFNQDSDHQKRNVSVDSNPTEVSEWTYFSTDYVADMKNAIENGYVTNLSLTWDEEFPLIVAFERDDIMSGSMMVAPRVQSD